MSTSVAKTKGRLFGFVVAFASVTIAFVLAALSAERVFVQVDRQVADLQTNALPSVEHLARAHDALRQLRRQIRDLSHGVVHRGSMPGTRAELEGELASYARTPRQAGEREVFDHQLRPSLDRLDGSLAKITRMPQETGNVGRAAVRYEAIEDEAIEGADLVDDALAELSRLKQVHAYESAEEILRMRRRGVGRAVVLFSASSLVAFVAAALAVRAHRRFASITKRNAELLALRADELESFSHRVAHDLVSPMSAVAFALAKLARRHPDPETSALVERANRAMERSRNMIRNILAFARAGAKPTPGASADLAAGIRSAVDELLASEQSPPAIELAPLPDCRVACDDAVLGVILDNLLSNAAKYSRDAPTRRIAIRVCLGPSRARVEVEDSGVGLPPGVEESIFQPYVRGPGVTQPGLGIGLATVKRLTESHEGAVGVRRLRCGTQFWFELPRATSSAEISEHERPAPGAGIDPVDALH